MSGIAGLIDPRLSREAGETLLKRMLESIRHRGPDHSSVWVDPPVLLGHNRLSVIDLTDRSNQPMEFDGLVIVYDGKVYNYLEIREELERKGCRFRTESDTEVILAAYGEWGGECVKRFVGMWAFAIWDKTKKELFCARDRFGIKPFYYIHTGDRFYFGSEYKPLKLSPLFNPEFNLRQIGRGLRFSMACYRDETYFECLKSLPERCNLLFKEGRVSISRYWDIDALRKFAGSFEEKKERFLDLFSDSVRLHMRSDVPVGGMLSGGIDSSSIASVIGTAFSGVRFKTFTVYYEGENQMDERAWVREVASTYSNLEPVFYNPSEEEVAGSFEAVVKAYDVPLLTPRPISRYFVMKSAAENNVKVILDGTGSESYLPGSTYTFWRHIAGYVRRLQLMRSLKTLNDLSRRHSLLEAARILSWSLVVALASERTVWLLQHRRHRSLTLIGNGELFSFFEQTQGSRLDQYLHHATFTHLLPTLLHRCDRMSMAFSLECRVPFLDHRLVEFGFSLEDEDKLREGQTKYFLRKSLERILPGAILARRDKQAFPSGETAKWLRGPLRHLVNPQTFDGLGVVDERKARRILQKFQKGDARMTGWVWRFATLNNWANHQ